MANVRTAVKTYLLIAVCGLATVLEGARSETLVEHNDRLNESMGNGLATQDLGPSAGTNFQTWCFSILKKADYCLAVGDFIVYRIGKEVLKMETGQDYTVAGKALSDACQWHYHHGYENRMECESDAISKAGPQIITEIIQEIDLGRCEEKHKTYDEIMDCRRAIYKSASNVKESTAGKKKRSEQKKQNEERRAEYEARQKAFSAQLKEWEEEKEMRRLAQGQYKTCLPVFNDKPKLQSCKYKIDLAKEEEIEMRRLAQGQYKTCLPVFKKKLELQKCKNEIDAEAEKERKEREKQDWAERIRLARGEAAERGCSDSGLADITCHNYGVLIAEGESSEKAFSFILDLCSDEKIYPYYGGDSNCREAIERVSEVLEDRIWVAKTR